MTDLSTGQAVTGTTKFMQTILVCINLGLGIVAGLAARRTEKIVQVAPHAVWIDVIAVVLAYVIHSHHIKPIDHRQPSILGTIDVNYWGMNSAFPLLVLLDGQPGHFPQLFLGSVLAYAMSALSSAYISTVVYSLLTHGEDVMRDKNNIVMDENRDLVHAWVLSWLVQCLISTVV
jgi:hypothetical protein